MADTNIEWSDKVWNPTVGCTRVSEGCRNCYAFQLHDMRHKAYKAGKRLPLQYAKPFKELQLMPDRLTDPLSWRKPQKVFVNSVSDLFHDDVPDDFLCEVFKVMGKAKQHTFQVLTKRAGRMQKFMREQTNAHAIRMLEDPEFCVQWPYPNVWLGVSVENQAAADERIPLLLQTPAAVRFLSCEPLIGPVRLGGWCVTCKGLVGTMGAKCHADTVWPDWVIVGGESGHGARPIHPDWVRSLRDQCRQTNTAFFFKQWGEWCPSDHAPEPVAVPTTILAGSPAECVVMKKPGQRFSVVRPDGGNRINQPDGRFTGEGPEIGDAWMLHVGKKVAGNLLDGLKWLEFPTAKV